MMRRLIEREAEVRRHGDRQQELIAHCAEMFQSLARSDQRRAGEAYVRGLLRCPGKKSIRRIAMASTSGLSDQSLRQFVNQSGWDPAPVRQRLANWVCARSTPMAWVIGEVAFPKHGRQSAGVERQYLRVHGRLSNCQLGVYVALTTPDAAVPVTWRLSIPHSWDADVLRRRKTRIPPDERHQPHWRYQIDALDDLCGDWGVPLAPVLLDLRQSTALGEIVHELDERGIEFLAQVDATVPVRLTSTGPQSVGRPGDRRPIAEGTRDDLTTALSGLARRTLSWLDLETDRVVRAQFARAQVRSVFSDGGAGRPAPASPVLLLEWGLGKHRPRTFWLSNMADRGLDDLVALTHLTRRATIDIDTMTDRMGLRDYEGRSFLGWHHHVTLVSVAHAFHLDNPGTEQPELHIMPTESPD